MQDFYHIWLSTVVSVILQNYIIYYNTRAASAQGEFCLLLQSGWALLQGECDFETGFAKNGEV
jgi:hypothetical protein